MTLLGGCTEEFEVLDDTADVLHFAREGGVLDDAAVPDEKFPDPGCWEVGDWSEIAYEGAGFEPASMDGSVKGHPVGRTQNIQLRESHEFSIESYTVSTTGDIDATEWQWHAHCDDDTDTYGRWVRHTGSVYFATGCTTTWLQVRVRAANC